jgi:hypothetical protein
VSVGQNQVQDDLFAIYKSTMDLHTLMIGITRNKCLEKKIHDKEQKGKKKRLLSEVCNNVILTSIIISTKLFIL